MISVYIFIGSRMVGTLGVFGCFWWNSLYDLSASLATLSLFSQVHSSSDCPFYLIRYCNLPPLHLESSISSTSCMLV